MLLTVDVLCRGSIETFVYRFTFRFIKLFLNFTLITLLKPNHIFLHICLMKQGLQYNYRIIDFSCVLHFSELFLTKRLDSYSPFPYEDLTTKVFQTLMVWSCAHLISVISWIGNATLCFNRLASWYLFSRKSAELGAYLNPSYVLWFGWIFNEK